MLSTLEIHQPADAAPAGHDPINRQLGVADQRIGGWFTPFVWTIPTGYLASERPPTTDDRA